MQQMPRRRQGHSNNNGGGLESSSLDDQKMGEEKPTGQVTATGDQQQQPYNNYLHKKFKKAEAVTAADSSGNKNDNPSLEALFQVTGHELQKIQSSTGVVTGEEEEKKKGHVCPYCGLFWGKPSVLQKHIRAHTNERPFPCLTCGFAFKTKSNLYKHCKTRSHHQKANHEGSADSSSSPPPNNAVEAMETDESEVEEETCEEPSSQTLTTTAPANHGTIYKPKFHSVSVNEAGSNLDVSDKSPKLATPEFLQRHITKLISQNAAIVDTFDSSWPQRYKRQASVPANVHLSDHVEMPVCSKERLRHVSEDGNWMMPECEAEIAAHKPKNSQNPEGSIIKDLLLKTRRVTPAGSSIGLSGGSLELSSSISSTSSSASSTSQQISSQCKDGGEKDAEKSLYSCHRCNIYFKSLENLDAHKRHYCPRLHSSLLMEVEVDGNVSQAHKPRGRPKGSKNRPKKEEVRVHSKSVSEGGSEEESRVTSRRNSIALGEGTESIKDILTSVKWNEEVVGGESRNPDGPILKKHLLQGSPKTDKNSLPIKKQKFESLEEPLWRRTQDFGIISKAPMRANNSVHLYGGEVEILDEGNGATKRIVIDSQFYNGQTESTRSSDVTASSVVATIAKPVHNSGGTVLQVQEATSLRGLKSSVCIPLPQVTSNSVLKTAASVVVSKNEVITTTATRPTTLSLISTHSSMMGTTLVSPETPRPNRKYGQCYFNGQYYTYLELKHSTRVYYCCIYRPQPMYIPQLTDSKLSMYSVWQTVPPKPDHLGLTPSSAMALYNSVNRTGCIYSTAPRTSAELTLTHSTYWTFQQQKKNRDKLNDEKYEKELAKPSGVKLTEEYTYVRGRGRGKYICHECGIRCKKPSMLKKHVRTHTDVRPYTCKHCNFSFKTKGNLTKHMKSKAHHKKCVEMGIVPVPITIDDAQIDEEAVERQERIEHQRKQFANDEDSEMDEDDEEEEEEEYDEEVRIKEGEDDEEEEEIDESENVGTEGQFEDAMEETVIKKTHLDQEMAARSLLDLGQQQQSLKRTLTELIQPELNEKGTGSPRQAVSSCGIYSGSKSGSGGGEYEQPIDLSMPHALQRAHVEEDVEMVEEDDDEVEQWSEEESEDIVVVDDEQQPDPNVKLNDEARIDVARSLLPTSAVMRLNLKSGATSCQPTPGVTQIYPSGSAILPRPHANNYVHRSMDDGKCVCTICNKSFSKPSQLRLHFNIHYFERPFRCDSCAISFRTKGHLQKHRRSVSHYNKVNMNMTFGTPTTDNPRPFKCPDCKIAFRIHGHLAKHLRSKMHIMKLECLGKLPFGTYAEIERSGVNLNEIDTTDCENSLESLQVMAHRLVDKGSPPGNISFTHRERTISGGSCDDHSDGLPYVAKSGSEEDLSRLHKGGAVGGVGLGTQDYEDISEDEELVSIPSIFRCHLCGKRVKSAKFLQLHMYVDHPDNNNDFSSTSALGVKGDVEAETAASIDGGPKNESEVSCELCGELCSSQQDLSQHLISHARCRPFICNLCDAAFTSIQYLKLHLVTHQQGIVFGCEECGGSFGSVNELELHMDRRHGLESVR